LTIRRCSAPKGYGRFTKLTIQGALKGADAVHSPQPGSQELREEVCRAMRVSTTFLRLCVPIVLASTVLGMGGCGSADNASAPLSSYNAKARKAHKQVPKAANPGQEDLSEMVAAVNASRLPAPMQMRFTLAQRPELGQPTDLYVALVPGLPSPDSVSISFQGSDGVDIVEGATMDKVDKPVEGTPLRHALKILPKRDGIFAVTAVVSTDLASQTTTRTFAIPVITGAGLPDLAAKPAVAKGS
jgi:hypothetical protein